MILGHRAVALVAALLFFLGGAPGAPADAAQRTTQGAAAPGPASTSWRAPLDGPLTVVRPFQPPPPGRPWEAGNRGVDLAAAVGAPVRAAGAGTVTFAGPLAGRGVVVVLHGSLRTTYEPISAVVTVGARVAIGATLGYLQPPGARCGGRPCLHWGLLRGEVYLDPMSLLGGVVRLLPLDAPAPRLLEAWGPVAAGLTAGVAPRAAGPGRAGLVAVAGDSSVAGATPVAAKSVTGTSVTAMSAAGATSVAVIGAVGAAGLVTRRRRGRLRRWSKG